MSDPANHLPTQFSAVEVAPEAIDPYQYDYTQHAGVLQTVKMIFLGLIFFPLRIVLFIFGFLLFWLTSLLGSCTMGDPRKKQHPQSKPISRFFLRVWSRIILWSLGYWWIVVDGENDESAPLLVANHVSFVDPFYFCYAMLPMAVAKAEVFGVPMLGTIGKMVQAIPVGRASAQSRHDVAAEIKRRTQWGIKPEDKPVEPAHASHSAVSSPVEHEEEKGKWPQLLIFPEATCTNTKCVIQFKLGAFCPQMAVQPVTLDYRQSFLDASWAGESPVLLTILRMMCQVFNKLHVTYLPVMKPSAGESIPDFAKRVQYAIAKTLNVPVSQISFSPPQRPAAAAPAEATAVVPPVNQSAESTAVVAEPVPATSVAVSAPTSPGSPKTGKTPKTDGEEEESVSSLVRSCSMIE